MAGGRCQPMSRQDNFLKAILENNPEKLRKALKPALGGMIKEADVNVFAGKEKLAWHQISAPNPPLCSRLQKRGLKTWRKSLSPKWPGVKQKRRKEEEKKRSKICALRAKKKNWPGTKSSSLRRGAELPKAFGKGNKNL